LSLGASRNISTSSGDSFGVPGFVAYNQSLGQIGVLFYDNTRQSAGGIGTNSSLGAVEAGQSPNTTPQYDAFVRVVRADLSHVNTTAITQSSSLELYGGISAFSQNGFVVGYSVVGTSTTTADIRAFHSRVDATGKLSGTSAQYPLQAVIPAGGVPTTMIFSISAYSSSNVSIIFNHSVDSGAGPVQEGVPENLRVGGGPLGVEPERPAASGGQDLFIASGEPITSSPAQGQVRIAEFTINGGDPIDPTNAPVEIPVQIVVENVSSNAGLQLDQIVIAAPVGFAEVGLGPPLPVTIFPSGRLTFNYTFSVNSVELQSGSNDWNVSASGFIGGFPTLGAGDASISVLGNNGTMVGVDVISQFNPTVLVAGKVQKIRVTVAVSNGGQETMRNLEISGALTTGFLPTDLQFKTFSPDPRTTTIPAGSIQIFETEIATSVAVKENTAKPQGYRPAVTVSGEQSSGQVGAAVREGSVTVQSTVGIRIDPP
ncbi:MAG: hypothetical protein KDB07_11735, partial [Planctomycetes bacterium]|nr:hypothetical protein [Planctomycetota bacterium]